jgi:hypothetical protein
MTGASLIASGRVPKTVRTFNAHLVSMTLSEKSSGAESNPGISEIEHSQVSSQFSSPIGSTTAGTDSTKNEYAQRPSAVLGSRGYHPFPGFLSPVSECGLYTPKLQLVPAPESNRTLYPDTDAATPFL